MGWSHDCVGNCLSLSPLSLFLPLSSHGLCGRPGCWRWELSQGCWLRDFCSPRLQRGARGSVCRVAWQSRRPEGHGAALSPGSGTTRLCPSSGQGPAPLLQAGSAPQTPGEPSARGFGWSKQKHDAAVHVCVLQSAIRPERYCQPRGQGGDEQPSLICWKS